MTALMTVVFETYVYVKIIPQTTYIITQYWITHEYSRVLGNDYDWNPKMMGSIQGGISHLSATEVERDG